MQNKMHNDEQEIRQLVKTWMEATKSGHIDIVLGLMTDDAVFLVPGQPPMRKADFASAARAQAGPGGPLIEGSSEIEELQVHGEFAFMRSRLAVTITPRGGTPIARSGYTLTIFRKEGDKWLLARDANLLAPAPAKAG